MGAASMSPQPTIPTSPRLLAGREFLKVTTDLRPDHIDNGRYDDDTDVVSFLAGVAWAEKQAGPVVATLKDLLEVLGRSWPGLGVQPLVVRGLDAKTTYHKVMGASK